MADNYTIGPQRRTVRVLGPDDVQDVIEVQIRTKPSGVLYPLRLPVALATPANIATQAAGTAGVIEADLEHPNVQAITLTQEPDVTGILQLFAHVFVASDNGEGQDIVTIIAPHLNEPQFTEAIQPTIDQLNEIQAL